MEDLRAVLMKLEQLFIEFLLTLNDDILRDQEASQEDMNHARYEHHELAEIQHEMLEVARGEYPFYEKYPEDRSLGWFWWSCLDALIRVRSSEHPGAVQWACESVKRIEDQSLNLQNQLVETADHIELSLEVQSAIAQKWMTLVERLASHDRLLHTSTQCQT